MGKTHTLGNTSIATAAAEAMRLVLSVGIVLASGGAAQSHWEYTRWGMTEAAVIEASGGRAQRLPRAERRRAGEMEYRAAGRHEARGVEFRIYFGFSAGDGLRCVSIRAPGREQAPALRAWITARFGSPQAIGGDERETVLVWSRPDNIQMLVQDGVAVALHCAE